ncbi:hypothetical protein BCU68_02270 [Vibrio sp. 10N.286.49.B3]|nr:hypothetical protein BCU68_02270 [Vibrio sp. 10N.286.49.B3]
MILIGIALIDTNSSFDKDKLDKTFVKFKKGADNSAPFCYAINESIDMMVILIVILAREQ